jgi:uncharacterized protein (DUF305 family)
MLQRWFVWSFTLVLIVVVSGVAFADGPVDGRTGRAEVRFLEGMIDHHQMALDMANQCVQRASTDEVQAICAGVIAAQTPEIEQMQAWLRDWYGIDYQPMPMSGSAGEHAAHDSAAPAPGGMMCRMMGGEGCAMMGEGGMAGMMGMMQGMMGGQGMAGSMDHMPMHMMQMQMMMMQMQMMQMMSHMGMGNMPGMPGMGMMGQDSMQQGMMPGMGNMPGMPGMSPTMPAPGSGHEGHHPAAEPTAAPSDSMPGMGMHMPNMPEALVTDPAMTMGMFAGLDRVTGVDYDIAWLEAMIEHHDGAVRMSERLQMLTGGHAELQALAANIIRDQTAEIAQMEALIAQLGA